jgi:L-threonylcarbamoyladenylate synthase
MEVLTQTELRVRFNEIVEKIKDGSVFIYPTDTVYGIGCNAKDEKSVAKIRTLKTGRPTAPFSIIVPSIEWIRKNCIINEKVESWLKKLPGPYTLILKLKNKDVIATNIVPEAKTIGVRLPDHWFTEVVKKMGIAIVTTSANKTGEPFMTCIENLDPDIENGVEFMIYEGPKSGRPSKLVNVDTQEIRER